MEKRNRNNLLSDIKKLLEGKANSHFLGNIVYVETKTKFMEREWSIVDGQQRLTTLFLLLYAIRDYLLSVNMEKEATALTNQYLENVNAPDINYKLRLKPLVSNDEEFRKIADLSNNEQVDANSLIRKNFNIIKTEVNKWFDIYLLDEIIDTLNKLYIVYISLDKTDNAQQIFESINSKGEGLRVSDLIRNFILMNKDDVTQTRLCKNYWKEIERNINFDNAKLEAFFRFYISTKNFALSSKNRLYADFIIYWENAKEKYTDEEILADILRFSNLYYRLYISKKTTHKKEIDILRKIQSEMPVPLLLGLFELQNSEKITELQFLECVQIINTYLIRRHMCNLDTSAISRFFPPVLKDVLDKCKNDYNNISVVLKYYLINQTRQKSSYMPDDNEVTASLKKNNAYVLSHTRTFFEVIEDENKIKIDKSNLTIEHIMPQTPTDYWRNLSKTKSDEEYAKLVNLIGNLTFADKSTNSSIGQSDFDEKKKRLEEVGKIDLSKDIFTKPQWGEKEINDRTANLTRKFIKTFPYVSSHIDYDASVAFPISYCTNGLTGKGKIYSKDKVIIDIDSEIRVTDNRNIVDEKIIAEMLENNELEQLIDKYILKIEMQFTSPSDAIKFIIGGSHNGWEYFKDEDGKAINANLRKLFDK